MQNLDELKPSSTSGFLLLVQRAARRLPHQEFRQWIFKQLQSQLRFDSGMWMRVVASDSGPQIHDHYLDRQRPDRISTYLHLELWREDPFMSTAFMNGPARAWAMSLSGVPQGRLRDFLELHEQRHVVCSFEFDPVFRSFAGFAMFRRGADDSFSEGERSWVEFVEPLLRDAWTQNWLREFGASRSDSLQKEFAQAVYTPDLILSASDDHFPHLIRREWASWEGPEMPAVWDEHLRRVRRNPWIGESVTAYFDRLPEGLVLVRAREKHALDSLPPRRREAALRFARGASQIEVAHGMRLSASTVNNYLVDVYRALDVNDKTDLAVLVSRLEPSASIAR